jgi:hypothetical protein
MTKDEKVFLTGLIKGIEGRFDGLEHRFDGLEAKVEQNSRDIRVNSMQIELMQNDISHINERDSFYDDMRSKVDLIYEIVRVDIPAIKRVVMDHSKRIGALEAKRV